MSAVAGNDRRGRRITGQFRRGGQSYSGEKEKNDFSLPDGYLMVRHLPVHLGIAASLPQRYVFVPSSPAGNSNPSRHLCSLLCKRIVCTLFEQPAASPLRPNAAHLHVRTVTL